MKNIIRNFYKGFDRFLEQSTSGNLRLKAIITAILTGILILIVIIASAMIAFVEFNISIPGKAEVNNIISNTTIEFKILVNPKYLESIETCKNVNLLIPDKDNTPFPIEITKIDSIYNNKHFILYLKNTSSIPFSIDEISIDETFECRIIIDRKKAYELLLK